MPKAVKSPYPKGVKAPEMPIFTALLAWLKADYGLTQDIAESQIKEVRGEEPIVIEKYQWQARVHMALQRFSTRMIY